MAHRNKHLFISPSYPPPLMGGSKVYLYNLVEHFPENADVLTSGLKKGWPEISSPRHHLIRTDHIFSGKSEDINPTSKDLFSSYLWMLGWLTQKLMARRYRVVIANAFNFANGFFFLLGKIFRVPVIGIGYAEEFTLCFKGKGFKNWIKRTWTQFTHRHATGFIVVCGFCKQILESIGIPSDRIEVIPPSINNQKAIQDYIPKNAGFRILSVGRLVERKGFHFLLEAVAQLKEKFPEMTLTLVGNGPYKPQLEEQIKRLGLSQVVCIRSWVTDEELVELYRTSSLFVLANYMLENGDTEGCPTVFLEAGIWGLPVIGGKEGGADTAISHEVNGFLVDSKNVSELTQRVQEILGNPELAKRMGKAGWEKIQKEHLPQITSHRFYQAIRQMTS